MTWNDGNDGANGGSCYNCHQIGPDETSFGNIGNSLRQFGNTRGNSPQMQKYVYEKIYNAKAFNLCSSMPRFGYAGTLTEQQIKDLVALLLDPNSPVNK
jgi:sulfur-oxidizing protein SoxX